jgi:hypothetical protein
MEIARIFVVGVVAAGIITALFLKDRQTVKGLNALFDGSSKLLGTAIKG